MTRAWLALAVETLVAIVVALVLGTLWQWFVGGSDPADAASEAVRVLFLFMDVGLVLWLLTMIVLLLVRRGFPGTGFSILLALLTAVLNAIVVLVVGAVQGGWGAFLVVFAIEAGIAFVIGVAIAAPIARRLAPAPARPIGAPESAG